ncbi:hypothetical protein SAMN02745164_02133 [Marinitoga hydrogenitolerans DSM 16785]|uniref:Uncharacterized protein n=1 Tax=Marinitoga hydrogenitolerans (strain DSM 16785 / JCM 12826 / AT1271) TaxID=1122195 RepID=A0A1M5A9N1_MARH1|nr:hypothetical protein [Marinitoga hydrogenitolerans]SHF26797.1 hypothetical protein SAMN02745164_02133 [Marinitoga hydrogenitolerans DSM 16785]
MSIKKLFLILILFISVLIYAEDSRKTLLIYSKGYSTLSAKVEHKLKERLLEMGKYRLIERDLNVLREVERILSGVTNKNDFKFNQLAADYIVYVEVIDANLRRKEDDEGNVWYEYEIEGAYRLIDVETSQILEIRSINAFGSYNVTKFVSEYEARENAKDQAIEYLVNSLVYRMNKLFLISANIINVENDMILIDAGRNVGIYKGMMFSFAKIYKIKEDTYRKIDGKLIVREVSGNSAILEILVKPKFELNQTIQVIENPDLSPIRGHLMFSGGYIFNDNYLFRLEFSGDNYKGFGFGTYLDFIWGSKKSIFSTGFSLNYVKEINRFIPQLGVDLYMSSSFEYDTEYSTNVALGISPNIGLEILITDNFGITLNGGYRFENALEGDYDPINSAFIRVGIDILF